MYVCMTYERKCINKIPLIDLLNVSQQCFHIDWGINSSHPLRRPAPAPHCIKSV